MSAGTSDRDQHVVALCIAACMHLLVIGAVYAAGRYEAVRIEKRALLADSQVRHIEAGLAIKSKSMQGRKTRQPQKDAAKKSKPSDVSVTRDETADAKDKKKPDPNDEIDPEEAMKRARALAEQNDVEPAGDESQDDKSQAGKADGHDFGLLDEATGDPYLGELAGRMTTNPDIEVPATVAEGGLETYGCVRLSPDGKVVEAFLDDAHKSANAAFNSAALRRAKLTSDMESAVPKHLMYLVESGVCVNYKY